MVRDQKYICALLRKRVAKYETQAAFAREIGVTPQFLSHVLAGKKSVTRDMAALLGYEPVRMYRKKGR